MFELLLVLAFCGLFFKALCLAFRMAWGTAKLIASVLFAIAVPLLLVCVMFVGGIALLLPLALMGIAFGVLRACV